MKWTPEKIEELRRRYPHEDNGRLARELGCTRKALVFRASFLGIRKTEEANEARYAAMSRRAAPESMEGERRQIATGTVIVRGNVLTHLSNVSASRDQARPGAPDEQDEDSPSDLAPGEALAPPAARPVQIACPHCKARITVPAAAVAAHSLFMEA